MIIHVLLVDDDARFRAYVRRLIADAPSVSQVTEAADGDMALRLLGQSDYALMLIDLVMPKSGGIPTTLRARVAYPKLHIVVISMHNDARMVGAAMDAGAEGFLLKDRLDRELLKAMDAVCVGETFLSAGLTR